LSTAISAGSSSSTLKKVALVFGATDGALLRDIDMKPSQALHTSRAAIRRVVESHRARNARIFGSVLHGRDGESSDLDILVDTTPETTLLDIGAIRHELGKLLDVPVDVLTPNALPDKFRAAVLAQARPI